MRNFLLLAGAIVLLYSPGKLQAQNKTLGVGVTTPNPNAALHVESPTGNQGFIMPRLTTAQRNAMTTLLTDADKGLMLYDSELKTLFIWDGLAWKSSSQVAGGPKLTYPYGDTVVSSSGAELFRLLYAGTSLETKGVAHFENQNLKNSGDVLSAVTSGTGSAGRFAVINTGSKMPALWAQTNSDSALSAPIYGLNTGSGDVAASFRIDNPASGFSAAYAETNGSGAAFFGNQVGLGRGGQFQIQNGANAEAAIRGFTNGTGRAGFFTISNPANSSPGVYSGTNGTGPAILGENTGATDGFAGLFSNTDAANNFPAVQASTAGSGPGMRVIQNSGTGAGVDIFMQNASSTAPAISIDQRGLGAAAAFNVNNPSSANAAVSATTNGAASAGNFNLSNASSTAAALAASTTGKGAALEASTSTGFTAVYGRHEGASNGNAALFEITDAANAYPALQVNTAGTGSAINAQHTGTTGDALYAERTAGTGSAGNFRISGNNNNAASVNATTVSAFGTAVAASNESNGIALGILNGGMQVTTNVVSVSTSISTRASAYRVTLDATTFSLDFAPRDGEVFLMYNDTAQTITINDGSGTPVTTLTAGQGKTFVVFPGSVIRAF